MKTVASLLFFILAPLIAEEAGVAMRPKLQIVNGSDSPVEIFWLKTEQERVPSGTVEAEKHTILITSLGHRFAVVGRDKEVTVTAEVPVQAFRFDPDSKDGVPAFYAQRIDAQGFPIVTSAKVNPYALKEAAYILNKMLGARPDVRTAMIKSGARMCILGHSEFTTDLPEFGRFLAMKSDDFPDMPAKTYWDTRARGMGGSLEDPLCTCAEENVLGFPDDPYAKECILIHEFAHCIHLRGMVNVDATFDSRLKATYDAAMKAGLWKGKYPSVNHHEYFAEGVQSWFDDNRENDHDHNHVNTRAELLEYDPGLARICREVFGDTEFKYTKPATRLAGHLAGYDPAKAPSFSWPERLVAARTVIKARAEKRNELANSREQRDISGWIVQINKELLGKNAAGTAHALDLLKGMLDEITRAVPKAAVAEMQKVTLYVSPEYPGVGARAEYHPDAGWLRDNQRDPAMAKGVEFTNVRIFDAEIRRMPNFALHELAHSFHDRVLGFDQAQIKECYDRAKAVGKYENVDHRNAEGRIRKARSYAMTNHKEYFAECTEAFFGINDIFPFNRDELKQHDPDMFTLLEKLWGTRVQ